MSLHTKADRDEQSDITIVNVTERGNLTSIYRTYHPDISSPTTLLKFAQFLKDEDALIINVSLSPRHLSLVVALKSEDWHERLPRATSEDWAPYMTPSVLAFQAAKYILRVPLFLYDKLLTDFLVLEGLDK